MRYNLLFFSLLFYTSLSMSQAFPIPAEGAEWNEVDIDLESVMGNQNSSRIELRGDTIIDNIKHSKLMTTWVANFYLNGPCQFHYTSGPYQTNTYLGAIRTNEDQHVHFVPADESMSYLIYDFSLSIGDTINWIRPENYGDFTAYISDIDSLFVESTYRKRIHLEVFDNLPDQWIEGIGSTFGLFSTFGYRSWEKIIHSLMCYRDNQIPQLLFDGNSCNMCDVVTSSQDNRSNDKLIIYPNPLAESSVVDLPDSVSPSYYRVYDLIGRVVYFQAIEGSEQIILHRKDYEQGVVFLEVIDRNNKAYLEKIVVN